jgi:hypothetical protein
MRRYSSMREIDLLVHDLIRNGWTFRRGGKHGLLSPPGGTPTVTVPCSPSDWRAFLNFKRDVRNVSLTSR